MPLELSFTLECEPTPQARPRHMRTKGGLDLTYKASAQKAREAELEGLLAEFAPVEPLKGSIALEFCAYLPVPKSASKARREAMLAGKIGHIGKPDLDNLAKQLKDAMTRTRFWHDDSQVDFLLCLKKYGERPCWQVNVISLAEGEC